VANSGCIGDPHRALSVVPGTPIIFIGGMWAAQSCVTSRKNVGVQ